MASTGAPRTGIALPGGRGYEEATRVFNLAAPVRPAAAVTARTTEQVRDAVDHARSRGLGVRVHSTGHAAATAPPMDDALLIRTRIDGGVDVDSRRRVARVPAGTRWGAVVDAAARNGLAAPHGSSPAVGVVGYLLRGGVSLYGRRTGLAANSVRAVELVDADGELRRADEWDDPELLWALKGGGGGFGVVTAVEIDLFPVVEVVTGAAFWPVSLAAELMAAWQRWTLDAPREATTSLRVMRLPEAPGVPPVLAARPVLCVDGAVVDTGDGTDARRSADDLLGPLRAVGEPLLDTWRPAAAPAVLGAHLDPADPLPVVGDHMLLGELGDEGAAAFLETVGEGVETPLTNVELRQLGGALGTPDRPGGALDRLDARYACNAAGIPGGPVTEAAIRRHCAAVRSVLGPWDTGRVAPTFVESRERSRGALDPERVRAVDRVRARVDPRGLFRGDAAPGTSETL